MAVVGKPVIPNSGINWKLWKWRIDVLWRGFFVGAILFGMAKCFSSAIYP